MYMTELSDIRTFGQSGFPLVGQPSQPLTAMDCGLLSSAVLCQRSLLSRWSIVIHTTLLN